MKYHILLLTIIATSGIVATAKPVFEQDFAAMKPGLSILAKADSNRSRLFPDPLPSARAGFSVVKAPANFKAEIVKGGLKLHFQEKSPSGGAELKLKLPPVGSKVTFEIKMKMSDFILGKKTPSMFFIYAAGVNLVFRSDRKDLRCYSMKTKKYARVAMVKNNEWYDIKAVMRFQKNGKSMFDLYINGKELLKNAQMRGNTSKLVYVRLVMHSKAQAPPSPSIIIRSINIK
jgi:hypothetical protein